MSSSVLIDRVTVMSPAAQPILRDVTLGIEPGESVAVIGRSGAGKTTLLRLLNGLAIATSGRVLVDGVPIGEGNLPERRRKIGTILQAPALFPHRTVFDNIATVPRLLAWDEAQTREAAATLMEQLDMPLAKFAGRFPRSLSGGEQQRVAIARAMIARPPLLLCDEPFSALDPIVRRELQDAFVALREAGDVTLLFVTHDVAEGLRVAKRIVLIETGAILFDGSREEFLRSGAPLVRRFIDATRIPFDGQ
jgi:osmoprotectant transport system ATP-binding protein